MNNKPKTWSDEFDKEFLRFNKEVYGKDTPNPERYNLGVFFKGFVSSLLASKAKEIEERLENNEYKNPPPYDDMEMAFNDGIGKAQSIIKDILK